jgi:hypothetical protein
MAATIALMIRNDRPWIGPVERRDPVTYRGRSYHETWVCPGPFCGHWTMNGAYKIGKCNFCNTARPAHPLSEAC